MFRLFFVFIFLLLSVKAEPIQQKSVVVTIKPIHSLVAAIGKGVFEPVLLIPSSVSAHTYQLKPQEVLQLKEADCVVWVGEAYETHLTSVLEKTVLPQNLISLMKAPTLKLYGGRSGCSCCCDSVSDGHMWLDPQNAIIIVCYLVDVFSEKDPTHASIYHSNGKELVQQLRKLDIDIASQLQRFKNHRYIICHDSLQYLDRRFGLLFSGSFMPDADMTPHSHDILKIRDVCLSTQKPNCVFTEPQLNPEFAEKLAKEFDLKVVSIDYLGDNIPEGPKAYEETMRALVNAIVTGLTP